MVTFTEEKAVLERALEAGLTGHLAYSGHDPSGHNPGNSRNGTISKKVRPGIGPACIGVPATGAGMLAPRLVPRRSGQIVAAGLRGIYTAADADAAFDDLAAFSSAPPGQKSSQGVRVWANACDRLTPFRAFTPPAESCSTPPTASSR